MLQSDHLKTLAGEYLKIARHVLLHGPARKNHVVFIGGVQRSGTNMVTETLEFSPDTKVFHERDTRVFDGTFCHQGDDVVRRMSKSALPCVVIKALSESHKISRLLDMSDRSSVLWVYRRYEPVIASNIAHWPDGRNDLDQIVVDRSTGDWRGLGMTDETHEILKRYYRPDLNTASAQALFWYYRNQLFFDQKFDTDPRALLIHYDHIAHDPATELGRIARFLGIAMPERAIRHVSAGPAKRQPKLDIEPEISALCDTMLARLDGALNDQIANRAQSAQGRSVPAGSMLPA